MQYLITGGTGLIGKVLIKILHAQGHSITVLSRDKIKAEKLLNSLVNHSGKPSIKAIDKIQLADIENADIVINLAGESIANKRWSAIQKHRICESRWDITQHLADLIKQAKKPPHLLISGSAVGIYGRQSSNAINEEFTAYHQEFTHTVCSKWEQLALNACSEKTRVAILRTGIVLAEEDGALAKMLPPFKLGLGGKLGDGKQMMSWIHIADMVAAIMHIAQTESLSGVINLTSENAVSNQVFTTTLSNALNRPSFFNMPKIVAKLLFGEMSDIVLYGQNVIPEKLKATGFVFSYPTLPLALEDLLH